MKVSDYIITQLKAFGIETVFNISGGVEAHLMESVRTSGLEVIHNYHEQAAAFACDSYFRIKKKPALLLVSNGPGSANALTGIISAWQDSIPIFVLSGQVPRNQTIAESGKFLRQFGCQEADIIKMVKGITKFAWQITDPLDTEPLLTEAWKSMMTPRMGPIWLEAPLDIQSAQIDVKIIGAPKINMVYEVDYDRLALELNQSSRPLVVVGSGVHLANAEDEFRRWKDTTRLPMVSTWSANDLFDYNDLQYLGNFGIFGERAANLAIQNADCLLILGSRMSLPNIGYAYELFSPRSKKIMVDIDPDEMGKKSLKIDFPVLCDVKSFLASLTRNVMVYGEWLSTLRDWKAKHHDLGTKAAYGFMAELSEYLTKDDIVVTDMGTSFTCTHQALRLKGGRLITSPGQSPMGFGLPGAIGAWAADKSKRIILIAGDGGLQVNIQELQTVVQNKIPLKMFILDSNGYLAISAMQDNLFGQRFGSSPETGVSSPSFKRIAKAYGIEIANWIDETLEKDGPCLCVYEIEGQVMSPRVQSRMENGKIVIGSLENMV